MRRARPTLGAGDLGRAQLGHARGVVSVTVRGHLPTREPGRAASPVAGGSALLPPLPLTQRRRAEPEAQSPRGAAVFWARATGKGGTGSHFTDVETEAQRADRTGSGSQDQASTVSRATGCPITEASAAGAGRELCSLLGGPQGWVCIPGGGASAPLGRVGA